MSWIGAVFISFYLFSSFYDMIQMNYFFNKGKIDVEVYERLKLSYFRDLYTIVTIIVLHFYKNANDKQNENNGAS